MISPWWIAGWLVGLYSGALVYAAGSWWDVVVVSAIMATVSLIINCAWRVKR